mgnify:CR=1 FL=1
MEGREDGEGGEKAEEEGEEEGEEDRFVGAATAATEAEVVEAVASPRRWVVSAEEINEDSPRMMRRGAGRRRSCSCSSALVSAGRSRLLDIFT